MIEICSHAAGLQRDDLMRNVKGAGRPPTEFSFVEFGFAEPDGHAGEILSADTAGCSCQARGIGASAQEHHDGNVGDQVVPHRIEQDISQLVRKLFGRRHSSCVWVEGPVGLGVPFPVVPDAEVPWLEWSNSPDCGPRRRDVTELKKYPKDRRIQLPGYQARFQKGLNLRCEDQPISGPINVERLDPQPVASEKEFPLANLVDGKSEHAADLGDTLFSILLVKMENYFGVGRGVKQMTALFELRAELGGVVGFAIICDPEIAVGAGHRLAAALAEVNDGQTRVDKQARPEKLHSLAIGAAVAHGHRHALSRRAQRLSRTCRRDPGDAAHEAYLLP